MRWSTALSGFSLAALALLTGLDASAQPIRGRRLALEVSQANCGGGAYSVVNSPDGTAISVLFDNFTVTGAEAGSGVARTTCAVEIPLNLPEGQSLGVFRMDYRGFAHLDDGQIGALSVDYGVGHRGPGGRNFFRPIRGPRDMDFTFSERLRPGVLRRAGCGEEAKLNLTAQLDLRAGSPDSNLTLDSVDGTRGVTFFVDLQPCASRSDPAQPRTRRGPGR